MLAQVNSSAVYGLDAVPVEVEVDIASQGLPSFTIVGLADKAVDEAKERVRSAIKNTGADFPAKRITVNLAPADLPKEGAAYDLPIAIGILFASEQIKMPVTKMLFLGELSLDGRVRAIKGVLSHSIAAKNRGITELFLPAANCKEAAIITNVTIYPVTTLREIMLHLTGEKLLEPQTTISLQHYMKDATFDLDLSDIKGQEKVKRAMEIAAAGGHNILLKGPPGAGKTLIARTLPSILPTLTFDEAIEVTKIYSIAGLLGKDTVITKRPFRAPHHTTSHIGLIGGGTFPIPGEISLAHRGVLFLDEFPEFPRHVLEALRQPLEDGFITISRAKGRIVYPAKSMLVAAQNPCPCGYLGSSTHRCSCTASQILRYQRKISGPMLDRIDIHLDVLPVAVDKLTATTLSHAETSTTVRKRVQRARNIQTHRFTKTTITTNADMQTRDIKRFCSLSSSCIDILKLAVTRMSLSARSYNRLIKLARTIADLDAEKEIAPKHIAEALQYRPRLSLVTS